MFSAAIITRPEWGFVQELAPGSHVAALLSPFETQEGRNLLELRDALWVALPGGNGCSFYLFRKAIEGTILDNLKEHGAGCLNINGCRVAHASPKDFARHKDMVDRVRAKGGSMGNSWKNSSDLSGASEVTTLGRWPTNLLLVHSPKCVHRGGRVDSEVLWECTPDCPVTQMNTQTGNRPGMNGGGKHREGYSGGHFGGIDCTHTIRADQGGGARFFPQFSTPDGVIDWIKTLITPPGGECYVSL